MLLITEQKNHQKYGNLIQQFEFESYGSTQ